MSPASAALAAMLVAGHALGDFAFQTDSMLRRKGTLRGILAHGSIVLVCHTVALAVFPGGSTAVALGAVVAAHVLIDRGKVLAMSEAPSRQGAWFLLDQLAHLSTLAVAWAWLAPKAEIIGWLSGNEPAVMTVGILVSVYAFNWNGMSAVVEVPLRHLEMPVVTGPSVGRIIGILERTFAVTLVLLDRWDALGLLVAAKSLARFRELEERSRAEYYLVGTLVSFLGAALSAVLARKLLGW
jgi:hypothetical protein